MNNYVKMPHRFIFILYSRIFAKQETIHVGLQLVIAVQAHIHISICNIFIADAGRIATYKNTSDVISLGL